MPDLYDSPYDILSSKIIPDDAFVDVDGVVINIPTIISILETGRDEEKRNDYDGDKGEGMDEEREKAERQIVDGRWSRWPTKFEKDQEKEIAVALNAIAQEIHVRCKVPLKRKYMADHCHGKTYGGRNRKPDLVVTPFSMQTMRERDKKPSKAENPRKSKESKNQNSEEEYASAVGAVTTESSADESTPNPITEDELHTYQAFGEVKSYSNPSQSDIVNGLGNYIYDVFAVQDDRSWVIVCAFIEAELLVYLYDRSGVVRTEKINIHERKEEFLRVAIGVLFVDDKYLGRDPTIKTRDGKRYITIKQSDDTHTELEIVKTIFRSKSFLGRGTTVWYVDGHLKYEKDKEGSRRRGYIVKDSWVDMSNKTKEYVILEKLRGFRNTPYMCTHEDMGERTEYFRQGGVAIDENAKIVFREHHRVVLGTVGQPITDFKSLKELILSFMNIFLAIIDLKIAKNILHCDISINNLLLIDIGNGKRDGCLIDFDYSVDLSDENTLESLTKRTGTVPFMAIEVLHNEAGFEHQYYHDIESAFYVLIWICLERSREWYIKREKKDRRLKVPDYMLLAQWDPKHVDKMKIVQVADAKYTCLTNSYFFERRILDLLSPEFENIKEYLRKLRSFFSESGVGMNASDRDPMVDREKLWERSGQLSDESAVEDAADLATIPHQGISDDPEEQNSSSNEERSSSDSGPISTSNVSEGRSSSEQTSLQTSEGSSMPVPQRGSKRKQRPSGGPGNFVSSESKKQKGSHEM